jgi:tetratricopeptide (TPR) repeat protein
MKIILSSGCVGTMFFINLLGGSVCAQERASRKPIPEVPELPQAPESPEEAEPKSGPFGIFRDKQPRKDAAAEQPTGTVEVDDDGDVSIEDTLFAPAKSGAAIDASEIPYSAPDEPIDASTIEVAATAPKDEQLELMQVYEGLRQFDNAIAAGNLVLKRDPNNKEALAGMGRLMVETGRSAEALDYADRLLALDPGAKSQALKASALMSAARVEEAEALLMEMKAAHKGDKPFPYETLIGFAKLDQAMKKEARTIFEAIENGIGYEALEVDTASKQLLLMDLDHALEWRDVEQAKASVATLREGYAGEPETAAAEAVEMFLEGSVEEATATLVALRSEFPRLRLYPFLLQLADFSYAAGDFAAAEAAYAESLADPRTRPLAREAAVRNRAQMRISEGGQASIDYGITNGEEGSLGTSTMKVRKSLNQNWYLGGEVVWQETDLDSKSGLLADDDRIEGLLVAERRLKKGRYLETKVGGSDAGAIGVVTVGKRARVYSDAWSAGIAANERANDSARLAALDGRQHRISATYQHEINPRTVITAEAIVRQVEIDGDELGNGAGVEVDLAYRLNEQERGSNYFIAWRSAYAKFNRSGWKPRGSGYDEAAGADQIIAGLIQPEYSRHGVELRHEGQWHEVLFTRAMTGLYYRTDNSDVEISAGVGLDWFFKDDMRLFVDALYTSSGEAGNNGGSVIEAKVGVAKSF